LHGLDLCLCILHGPDLYRCILLAPHLYSGILDGPDYCSGIMLGPDLCPRMVCRLDVSVLLHGPDLCSGILHGLCLVILDLGLGILYGLFGAGPVPVNPPLPPKPGIASTRLPLVAHGFRSRSERHF